MKTEKILNKKIISFVFVWITLFLILSNPQLQAIQIYYSTQSVLSVSPNPNSDSFFSGSTFISYKTDVNYITNSTTNLQEAQYIVTITYLNFSSIMLLFLPLIVFVNIGKERKQKKDKD